MASGDANRAAAITGGGPKVLLNLGGVPLLHRQLEWLAWSGYSDCIVWTKVCHLGGIMDALRDFADGRENWAITRNTTVQVEEASSGSGGGVQKLLPLLQDVHALVMADILLADTLAPLDIPSWADSAMLVTDGARDARNVRCDERHVLEYSRGGGLTHTDAGVWLFRKPQHLIGEGFWEIQDELLPRLATEGRMAAIHTHEEPMHLGDPESYARAQELWRQHRD